MKTGDESTPSKSSKPSTSAPEPAAIPSYPDWSNSMQAYYGAAPTAPPFFASTVTSPAPYGYLLGGQHALIPPYGTPMPYQAIFPPSGVYAHPTMTPVPNTKYEAKVSEVKEKAASKKNSASKMAENGETASASGNDAVSLSGEMGSEGSSNASDGNTKQESTSKNGKPEQNHSEANANANVQSWKALPATNLNIGMDLWNSSASAKMKGNPSQIVPDQWIPDERELKRQKRKQSNRESARRSRLRKQAECEELQARVQNLTNENRSLRDELKKLSDECDKIKSENETIKDELTRVRGSDASANLELGNSSS